MNIEDTCDAMSLALELRSTSEEVFLRRTRALRLFMVVSFSDVGLK